MLLILAIVVLTGGVVFNISWHFDKAEKQFHAEVSHIRQHLRQLMAQNESILSGFSAFLLGNELGEIDKTRAYARKMLERYPQILMFEVAQRVDSENMEPFSSYLRAQNVDPPRIWSYDYASGFVEYDIAAVTEAMPVIFIEPESENSQLGLNLQSIEFINSVVDQFRNDNRLLISEPIELIDGDSAIAMMQGVNVNNETRPRYISLLVVKTRQLIPPALKGEGWYFNLSGINPDGVPFSLLSMGKRASEERGSLLPVLISEDSIALADFELQLMIDKQLLWSDLDWYYILIVTFLMLLFPLLVAAMYRVHQGIEQSNLQKQQELYRQANFDSLTGLANRLHFEDFSARVLSSAERNQIHIALFFIDLNGFKLINDKEGHDVGDLVLKRVADALTDHVRLGDMVARLGGDEFVILMDRVPDLDSILTVLNKIRGAISDITLPMARKYRISASVGFAYSEYHGYALADLMKAADNSMYGEKQQHYDNRKSSGSRSDQETADHSVLQKPV